MHTNLFAYTPAKPMPEFLSINREDDGTFSVTVRSAPTADVMQSDNPPLMSYGQTATIRLPADEFSKLVSAIASTPTV